MAEFYSLRYTQHTQSDFIVVISFLFFAETEHAYIVSHTGSHSETMHTHAYVHKTSVHTISC